MTKDLANVLDSRRVLLRRRDILLGRSQDRTRREDAAQDPSILWPTIRRSERDDAGKAGDDAREPLVKFPQRVSLINHKTAHRMRDKRGGPIPSDAARVVEHLQEQVLGEVQDIQAAGFDLKVGVVPKGEDPAASQVLVPG